MVRCQISANMSSFLPVVWNHVPPYFSHLHLISFKRLSDLFYFCFISFQLLFNILQNLLSGCHQFFNLWVLAFFVCKKESFVQKCTFGGWIWPATLVGWFCDSYLFAILYSPFFLLFAFPRNGSPGWTIYTEKCPYLFRIDLMDFIILALVSRNCPTYFSLLPLVPINFWPLMAYFIVFSLDFSSFFQSIVTMGCHHLFNLFHQFQHQFLLVSSFFGKDFKRSSLFKSVL